MTLNGPTEKIQGAGPFSQWTVALSHRAGYQENISIHDIKAKVLVRADDEPSDAKQAEL